MADKEPYDRAAPLHLTPQLTTRKEKRPQDEPTDSTPRLTNGGFYLSTTAQKAKLMLPTALWILLFIAGICFLTLLASLNKTIGTLDTLVEMEQAREAREALSESLHQRHHHHHHQQQQQQHGETKRNQQGKSSRLSKAHMNDQRADLDVSATDDWRPASASWFSAPSWTSLEPRHREQRPPADLVAEIVPLGDVQDGNFMVASSEPLGPALMSQVLPIFESLTGGPREPELARAQLESPAIASGSPMISAKIDNVHVHLGGVGETADNKRGEAEDINSLEKSIDQLIGKLMDQRAADRKQTHKEQLLPVFPQFDDLLAPPPPPPMHHHGRRPPMSPLSQLLGPSPNSLFFQEEPMVVLPLPQPIEPHHKPHQKPADQLFVSFSDELKPLPSRETNRHNLSNTRRPTPYEFAPPPPPPMMLGNLMSPFDLLAGPMVSVPTPIKPADKKHDAPWDMLATDLADSLVQGMFQQMQAQPRKPTDSAHQPDENQFVVISDGMPNDMPAVFSQMLGPHASKQQKQKQKPKPKQDDDLGDIVNLFFGPSREWDKQQQQQKPSIRITEKPITDSVTKATIAPVISHKDSKLPSVKLSAPSSDKQLEQLVSQLPTSGPLSKSEQKLIHDDMGGDMFTDLIGSMFSLPQMSGHSPPVSTSSGASGSPAGGIQDTTTSNIAALTSAEITTVAPKTSEQPIVTKLTIEPFKSATKLAEIVSTTATTATPEQARLTTSISNAPVVEVISELDTPDNMPVIDLAPFARSKNAFDEPKATTTTTTKDNLVVSTTLGDSTTTSSSKANSTQAQEFAELVNKGDASAKPLKNFFEKADEFIERNFLNLKRVFQ